LGLWIWVFGGGKTRISYLTPLTFDELFNSKKRNTTITANTWHPSMEKRDKIYEDEYLSELSEDSITKMADEIGYKDGWKKVGLKFRPEVTFEFLKEKHPALLFDGGNIAICKVMISTLAKQNVKMDEFLRAVDEVGLRSSASSFRKNFVLPGKAPQVENPVQANNNNAPGPAQPAPEAKEPDFTKEEWYLRAKPVIKNVTKEELADAQSVPVAIFVVNDTEKNAVLRDFAPLQGKDSLLRVKKSGQFYTVGRFGNYNAVLTQTDMGGESVLSFDRAISDWKVKILIAIGVAWGTNPKSQKLGDVLVSKEIAVYGDNDKAQNGEYNTRSHIPKAGANILRSLKEYHDSWEFKFDNQNSKVHIGRIISAGLLVNDQEVKNHLLQLPQHQLVDIIGGDMEAKELAHVVYQNSLKVQEWVMVKGICDWADGNKHKGYQPLAAAAASGFVKFVLSQPDVLDDIINPN
jgi:nucleoside phosphorylase